MFLFCPVSGLDLPIKLYYSCNYTVHLLLFLLYAHEQHKFIIIIHQEAYKKFGDATNKW